MLSETRTIKRLRFKVFCPSEDKTCPPEDKTTKRRPVLCFLHGNGEHSGKLTIEQALGKHGPLQDDAKTRDAVGNRFIVVFPQLFKPGGDVWGNYADDVEDIVKFVWDEYGGDPKRTYLTGFSFGGNGVFCIASKKPGVWAALWPVDPTIKPIPESQLPVWLSLGPYSRCEEEGLQKLRFQKIGKESDNSAKFVYLDYGANHGCTATETYRDKRAYKWLLNKSLE